jgi:hypothetical protein
MGIRTKGGDGGDRYALPLHLTKNRFTLKQEGLKMKTYSDYEKLPEGAPYQLINGMFVESPSPTPYHQGTAGFFYQLFLPLQKKNLGKVKDKAEKKGSVHSTLFPELRAQCEEVFQMW